MRPKLLPHENKLISALSQLSRKEMTRFVEYVHSPYFNKHEKLKQLVDLFNEVYPQFEKADLSKRMLSNKILSTRKHKPKTSNLKRFEQQISDFLTYLYRLLEDFLALENYYRDELRINRTLMKELYDKRMFHTMRRKIEIVREQLSDSAERDSRFYYNAYQLENFSDLYQTSLQHRTTDTSLQRKVDMLDVFYLAEKLRNSCEMINRSNIVQVEFKSQMIEELTSLIEENQDLINVPVIAIYYRIYLTLTQSEIESHYREMIKLLEEHNQLFTHDEARLMFDYAQNYCIKKINSGKTSYLHEIFLLYQSQLKKELVFDKEILAEQDYKNIVTVATRLKEFKWAQNFIQKYKEYLPGKDQENAYTFNLASLYYTMKDYNRAAKLLVGVEFTDVYYALSNRSLLLKIFYEQQDDEPLFSLVDSFKTYLNRNKEISVYQRNVHLNLVRLTARAARLRSKKNYINPQQFKLEFQKLKKKIDSTEQITNVSWLKEMVGSIETF